jgi:uncharacterized protein YlbG (UPF0298 family)
MDLMDLKYVIMYLNDVKDLEDLRDIGDLKYIRDQKDLKYLRHIQGTQRT